MTTDKTPATLASADASYTTGHCAHNNRPGGCQLHNLQCGWPACDRRPAKPSLATVKHGGCVQLGQHDLSTSEGGRRFIAEYFTRELHRHDFTRYITTRLAADFACALAQHLSAQPSPGGQGTVAEEIELIRAVLDGYPDSIARSDALRAVRVIGATLAARQPVGELVRGAVLIDGTVHLVQKGEEMDWARDRGATLLFAIDRSMCNG